MKERKQTDKPCTIHVTMSRTSKSKGQREGWIDGGKERRIEKTIGGRDGKREGWTRDRGREEEGGRETGIEEKDKGGMRE